MFERFLELVERGPHAVAMVANDVHVTRGQLLDRANELAAELIGARMTAGDALAIQLPNSIEFVAGFLAAVKLRLVVVPIDRDAAASEVATILSHFSVRAILECGGIATTFQSGGDAAALLKDACLIKLSSGSTGQPKGIVTTAENLIGDCTNICATMGIAPHDINLGAIPFSHSYGFSNLVTPLILQGTPIVVTNDYLPQALVDLANRHRCTVAPLIPMVYEHLIVAAHGEFETVRTFISAGAPLPAHTSRRFRERFGVDIHSFYGTSETGGITYDRRGGAVERGTVGSAMEGVELSIENARLTVRGRSVSGGVFVTDDLVELREDGELALTGRASDLINTAGKKVNPREVEAVILQIDGVREAKVYGEPAGARGEVVAAAVVASPDVTRDVVRAFCRARLSLHKVPRIVKLVDAMPVDDRGKIRRAALAAL